MGIATMVIKHGQLNSPTQKKAEHKSTAPQGLIGPPVNTYLVGGLEHLLFSIYWE